MTWSHACNFPVISLSADLTPYTFKLSRNWISIPMHTRIPTRHSLEHATLPPVQRQRGADRTSAKAPASCAAHFYLTTLKSFPAHKSTTKKNCESSESVHVRAPAPIGPIALLSVFRIEQESRAATPVIDPRYEWCITFLSQFSNFAKPAFNWLGKSAKLASNWL